MLTTLLTSGLFTRPTQAVFLTSTLGCLLNIGVCPKPGSEPDVTNPGDIVTPADPTNPTEEPGSGENPNPDDDEEPDDTETPLSDDTTPPAINLAADPLLAGGNTQTVTITGTVSDENLSSYVLTLNDNVVQEVKDIETTSVEVSVPWSVAVPNKVPSGTYTIKLVATDKAENSSEPIVIFVEVDNSGPVVDVTGGDTIIKSGSISPNVTAEDPRGVVSYAWTADENNPGVADFDPAVQEPVFTPYFEGTYVFYVQVTDGLGNISTDTFSFGYARQLAIVPLPVIENLGEKLVTPATETPAVTPASSNAPSQINDTTRNAEVLGSTVMADDASPITIPAAAIAPTSSGWSILGILWYWWLVAAAVVFASWIGVKRLTLRRAAQQS